MLKRYHPVQNYLLGVLGLALLLCGCAGEGVVTVLPSEAAVTVVVETTPVLPTSSATPIPQVVEVTVPPMLTPEMPVDPYTVSLAVDDLAQSLGIPIESIRLVKFELVTWGDPSLGCPQPGMAYIQVPVDGALIVLEAGGIQYEYHSGGDRPPFLCQPGLSTYKEQPPGLDITPPGGVDH